MAAKTVVFLALAIACAFLFAFLLPYPNLLSRQMGRFLLAIRCFLHSILHLVLINTDWLYWSLLFIPFYAFYVCIGEKLYMLKSHVTILQQDVNGKTRFIEWQNMALSQLDTRLMDMRKEVDVLRKSNNNFRQEEEMWRKSREMLKKRLREQQKMISQESTVLKEEVVKQEVLTVVKKNKSDSNLKSKKINDDELANEQPARPKTQPQNRSLPSIVHETKKGASPEWERARLRLLERSKKLMKDRVNNPTKKEEEFDNQLQVGKNSERSATKMLKNKMGSVAKASSELVVPRGPCLDPLQHSRSSDPVNAVVAEKLHRPGCPWVRNRRVRRTQSEVLHGGVQEEGPHATRRKRASNHHRGPTPLVLLNRSGTKNGWIMIKIPFHCEENKGSC